MVLVLCAALFGFVAFVRWRSGMTWRAEVMVAVMLLFTGAAFGQEKLACTSAEAREALAYFAPEEWAARQARDEAEAPQTKWGEYTLDERCESMWGSSLAFQTAEWREPGYQREKPTASPAFLRAQADCLETRENRLAAIRAREDADRLRRERADRLALKCVGRSLESVKQPPLTLSWGGISSTGNVIRHESIKVEPWMISDHIAKPTPTPKEN